MAAAAYGERSPTLSDAGMILPAFEPDFAHAFSPSHYIDRPPSPPLLYQPAEPYVKLHPAPHSRRRPDKSASPSTLSSRSTPHTMVESDAAMTGATSRENTLASSPTIHDALDSQSHGNWKGRDQRRASAASSSSLGDDLNNWPGFDSHGAGLAEEQHHGDSSSFIDDATLGDDAEMEQWSHERSSGSDEDDDGPYSSAALSRRAEMILANAKKRLNDMEGNLRGARESLVVSPAFGFASNTTDLSHHISVTRERDRRLYAGMGPIPPRMYSYRSSPLSAKGGSGHARGLSETSVSQPFTTSYASRPATNKRSSSAIGHASGPWSGEGYGQGRFPIKESRSIEVLRDPRSNFNSAERENAARSNSRSSKSPPGLETLPEDEDASKLQRSSSAASGLRDQMNDLKGRISSLKLKAQEDNLRRQSLQSLRTPSPFTSAETWYSGTHAYQSGGSPITANAGLGIKTVSPTRKAMFEDEFETASSPTTTTSQHEGETLVIKDVEEHGYADVDQSHAAQYGEVQAISSAEPESFEDEDDMAETDEGDYVSVNGDGIEAGTDSVYEDAVYEMPSSERHEDRVDAFDYEHFFLHSAMGTYSLDGRRDSTSSGSSTATTRPVTAMQSQDEEPSHSEKRISIHQRNPSVDSVSTVATFATAAENRSDDEDDEEENEQMDQFSQQILANTKPVSMRTSLPNGGTFLRTDSAIYVRRANGSSPTQTSNSRGSSSPGDLASGLQTSKIFSILTEASRDEARVALSEEETQLIYGLAASFQQACANLQNIYGEAYERKAWRRRLDEARRILNGEDVLEDDQSF